MKTKKEKRKKKKNKENKSIKGDTMNFFIREVGKGNFDSNKVSSLPSSNKDNE